MTDTPTSNCAMIREVIRQAGRPLKMGEITAKMPAELRRIARQHVCVMVRTGVLKRHGTGRLDYTYELGREIKPRAVKNSEEFRAAMREKWRKAAADKRARKRANLPAPARAKAAPKPRPSKPAPAPRVQAAPTPRPLVRESVPSAAPPQPVRRQTVEEFLAAGGKIERLPLYAVSQPLRRIGMEAARAD